MLAFMQSAPALIGTDEVAAIFHVDRSTVTRWVSAGKLSPVVRRAGMFLFDEAKVREIAEAES